MVFALAVPAYINQTISGSRGTWPIAQCRVELGGGPGRRVLIRCSLSMPGRSTLPGSSSLPRTLWFGSSSLVSKDFFRSAWSTMLQNHKVWGEKSLQTLQRVGTMLRSTSKDCIAALATKTGTAKQQMPDPGQEPQSDGATAGQLKASIGRFLTTAGAMEVQQAAMLSDLSNLAYDVAAIDHQQLQERHNVVMVANSRSMAAAQEAKAAGLQSDDTDSSKQQLPAAVSTSVTAAEQLPLPATNAPAAAPSSIAVAGAPPMWDGASQYHYGPHSPRSSSAGSISAPASPRTPFVMASMTEGDDITSAGSDTQPATASAELFSPSSPRLRTLTASSTALSAPTATSMCGAAPAAVAVGDAMPGSSFDSSTSMRRSSSSGTVLAAQFAHLQQQQQQELLEKPHNYQPTLDQQEQQALLELQQQEQAVLLELQQQQQMQMLFQQEQAMFQMLQEQNSTVSPEAAAASTAWWWWWQQQQQQQQAAASTSSKGSTTVDPADQHPTEWFVCDEATPSEADSPVRYFVFQGSITLDHWRINLTIDPSEFEGGAFGPVKVHRGVYETALQMLDTFVPFVREHLAEHPNGKLGFAGHSLGGSIATLLMLLMVHRGILPAANVATVRTFGAPAIFCEGATGSPPSAGACQSCSLPCQHRAEHSAASAAAGAASTAAGGAATAAQHASSVLGKLGLSQETVVNVVMTRDIVPRAFVCDYTVVADFMKSWMPSFKEHHGLAACKEHKALYNFIGTVEVLQPSTDCPFVLPDEAHAMLPDLPALYKLTEPCCDVPELQAGDCLLPEAAAADVAQLESLSPAAAEAPDSQQVAASLDWGVEESVAGLVATVAAACNVCNRSSCSDCTKLEEQTGPEARAAAGGAETDAARDAEQTAGEVQERAESPGSSRGSSKKSKLGSFGSWGSLVSLGHLSLTSVIADLTSTFTLVTSNSGMVSMPADSAADTAGSDSCSREPAASSADASVVGELVQGETAASNAALTSSTAETAAAAAVKGPSAATAVGATADPLGLTLGDAILTFMNSPHPLETLGEMRAYGPSGSISRFHNPNNYTVALQQLCAAAEGK